MTNTGTNTGAEVQPTRKTTATLGECPHCGEHVVGFQMDATSRDDVVVTLKPCGCASHSSDGYYPRFIDLVKASGSLS